MAYQPEGQRFETEQHKKIVRKKSKAAFAQLPAMTTRSKKKAFVTELAQRTTEMVEKIDKRLAADMVRTSKHMFAIMEETHGFEARKAYVFSIFNELVKHRYAVKAYPKFHCTIIDKANELYTKSLTVDEAYQLDHSLQLIDTE